MKNNAILMKQITTSKRINEIDIVRGIALWGILIVNMGLFSFPALYTGAGEVWQDNLNRAVINAVNFLGEGKFISVFSFLFGLGFTIFMKRAAAKTAQPKRLFARRLLILLGIGLVHSYFIWYGDVLVIYSVFGFVLMLFWNTSAQSLLSWAFYLLILPVVLFLIAGLVLDETAYGTSNISIIQQRQLAAYATHTYSNGSLRDIFLQNMDDLRLTRLGYLSISPQIFAMFLLGAYAGIKGFFDNLNAHESRIRHIQIGALIIGLPIAVASTLYHGQPADSLAYTVMEMMGSYLAGPTLGLFYLTSILLLLRKESWYAWLKPFAAVGRMAATNYIMQSVICVFICYSFGLGKYGAISPFWGLVLSTVIILFQIGISNLWLKYFKFGPVEWIWRYLTYKNLPQTGA